MSSNIRPPSIVVAGHLRRSAERSASLKDLRDYNAKRLSTKVGIPVKAEDDDCSDCSSNSRPTSPSQPELQASVTQTSRKRKSARQKEASCQDRATTKSRYSPWCTEDYDQDDEEIDPKPVKVKMEEEHLPPPHQQEPPASPEKATFIEKRSQHQLDDPIDKTKHELAYDGDSRHSTLRVNQEQNKTSSGTDRAADQKPIDATVEELLREAELIDRRLEILKQVRELRRM